MNHEIHYTILLRSLKALRHAGTHGPQSLSAMRTAGNEALVVLIERELMRVVAEMGEKRDPLVSAIERAQERSDQEMKDE